MELQSAKIDLLVKDLEKNREEQVVKEQLEKMEKCLQEYEPEIMERKTQTFTRDKLNYQYGIVYTFAKRFDNLVGERENGTID
ncbi:hypothetical protein NDU88_000413 [Pleurodeles waltl]|uniref:Uncharacterized protein n=1 Tax=Pleurodeles waltl TaxID=8319 RepID=A0AAV7UQX2_PLEWA|nr:hypothetical protein NDU88_000413 [Pleurodeles waltl]